MLGCGAVGGHVDLWAITVGTLLLQSALTAFHLTTLSHVLTRGEALRKPSLNADNMVLKLQEMN